MQTQTMSEIKGCSEEMAELSLVWLEAHHTCSSDPHDTWAADPHDAWASDPFSFLILICWLLLLLLQTLSVIKARISAEMEEHLGADAWAAQLVSRLLQVLCVSWYVHVWRIVILFYNVAQHMRRWRSILVMIRGRREGGREGGREGEMGGSEGQRETRWCIYLHILYPHPPILSHTLLHPPTHPSTQPHTHTYIHTHTHTHTNRWTRCRYGLWLCVQRCRKCQTPTLGPNSMMYVQYR